MISFLSFMKGKPAEFGLERSVRPGGSVADCGEKERIPGKREKYSMRDSTKNRTFSSFTPAKYKRPAMELPFHDDTEDG